jgi:hypothetical protein
MNYCEATRTCNSDHLLQIRFLSDCVHRFCEREQLLHHLEWSLEILVPRSKYDTIIHKFFSDSIA